MKLDNIIYDVDSLKMAIAEQWSADSEVFASIYPSDTATALINGMAAFGSLLQYTIVSCLANCYTTTAFSDSAVYQLADTLGNDLHGNVSSQVIVNITKNNLKEENLTIPQYSTFVIGGKKFFNPYEIILPANVPFVYTITLVQGEIIEVNKTTSGIANEKFYFSSEFKASPYYIRVFVNDEEWNVVESFLQYDKSYVLSPEDMNSVVLKTDPDGRAYVKVGNGQLGTLPMTGSVLQVKYCSNDGKDGNIDEKGAEGVLESQLVYTDRYGNQQTLDVTVVTTTTAYGGFSKQSVETLRLTSPWVFASGHRAIRRQDYNALLQNQCGYITSQVWGEYEEANRIGAYDHLMMNMVYYTGIKNFRDYPYFKLDTITNPTSYNGALYSNSGFYGSYNLRLSNMLGSKDDIYVQDTGAQGWLFINDNDKDPRDSLLPDWIASENRYYRNIITFDPDDPESGTVGGLNYKVNDELWINVTVPPAGQSIPTTTIQTDCLIRVKEVDSNGKVLKIELLTKASSERYNIVEASTFSTTYYKGISQQGIGLIVKLSQEQYDDSDLITTNDFEYSEEEQENPLINARSDKPNGEDTFYRSVFHPTLQYPVQIRINYEESKTITGVKFKATNPRNGAFIGTIAMFGSAGIDDGEGGTNPPSYVNVRNNSEDWTCIINRKELSTPYNSENDNDCWSDWIATSCFLNDQRETEKDGSGNPVLKEYKYYVIEFYSTENTSEEDSKITFDSMKVLYSDNTSLIFYTENGEIRLNLPTAGDPGPGTEDGYIETNLITSNDYPLYNYGITLAGITKANGYEDNDILVYKSTNGSIFRIKVVSIANEEYLMSVNGNEVLVGNDNVQMASNQPVSFGDNKIYTYTLDPITNQPIVGNAGSGYKVNDVVYIARTDPDQIARLGEKTDLSLRVAAVDSSGAILALTWLNNELLDEELDKVINYDSSPTITDGAGVNLRLVVVSKPGTLGTQGTILIKSSYNIEVNANFKGDRINTADVNYYDEPIIKKFNHFTTYLEFIQPEMHNVSIHAQVAIKKNSQIASGIVLQNVRTNIQKLFEITPDYMGKDLKLSDIYRAITSTEHVSWCKVLKPLDNQNISANEIMICQDIILDEVQDIYE